jgi:multiple sugar transport system ATP-binding protein
MSTVSFRDVEKRYPGGTTAVNRLNLEVGDGEFMVFVGPSGCGKTTALRMTAGLETISGGEIAIDDERVNDVSPQRRDIAMVFQEYALYPQMNVFDNIAFGLRLRKLPRKEVRARVEEMARTLDMEDLLGRKPRALSGGQRQRVAMGRALVRDPKVFLMDEPLSNLDAKLRVQMRYEVTRIQRELGTTTIYVTHDQVEAMTMGTRVAVMRGGDLQQVDRPETLYEEPANLFVAAFIGSPEMNLMRATPVRDDGGLALRIGEQVLELPEATLARHPALATRAGQELILGLRPEALAEPAVEATATMLRGEVTAAEMLGADRLLHIEMPGAPTVSSDLIEETGAAAPTATGSPRTRGSAVVARFDAQGARPSLGEQVEVAVALDRAHFFDAATGERI